jgi:hypothetical protein
VRGSIRLGGTAFVFRADVFRHLRCSEQLRDALEVYEASDCGSRKQAFAKAMKPAFSPAGTAVLDW